MIKFSYNKFVDKLDGGSEKLTDSISLDAMAEKLGKRVSDAYSTVLGYFEGTKNSAVERLVQSYSNIKENPTVAAMITFATGAMLVGTMLYSDFARKDGESKFITLGNIPATVAHDNQSVYIVPFNYIGDERGINRNYFAIWGTNVSIIGNRSSGPDIRQSFNGLVIGDELSNPFPVGESNCHVVDAGSNFVFNDVGQGLQLASLIDSIDPNKFSNSDLIFAVTSSVNPINSGERGKDKDWYILACSDPNSNLTAEPVIYLASSKEPGNVVRLDYYRE